MSLIYTPKGKAREYSPLALNVYNGCDHGCSYCYLRSISKLLSNPDPQPRKGFLETLEKELNKYAICEQVLLSFSGDPYCAKDVELGITRKTLELLLKRKIMTAILTKGGYRCLRDLDLFKKFPLIKVGTTLTLISEDMQKQYEPGAASTLVRMDTLHNLHKNKIHTWVSMEPVIDPQQSLELIRQTLPYVDEYKVGKLNHNALQKTINWTNFGLSAVAILREAKKPFYIKKDLRDYLPKGFLTKQESDMDYLAF